MWLLLAYPCTQVCVAGGETEVECEGKQNHTSQQKLLMLLYYDVELNLGKHKLQSIAEGTLTCANSTIDEKYRDC